MSKFNVGDRVILVKHSFDSAVNVDIGVVGVVMEKSRLVEKGRVNVEWEQNKGHGEGWYVDDVAIELYNPSLENE